MRQRNVFRVARRNQVPQLNPCTLTWPGWLKTFTDKEWNWILALLFCCPHTCSLHFLKLQWVGCDTDETWNETSCSKPLELMTAVTRRLDRVEFLLSPHGEMFPPLSSKATAPLDPHASYFGEEGVESLFLPLISTSFHLRSLHPPLPCGLRGVGGPVADKLSSLDKRKRNKLLSSSHIRGRDFPERHLKADGPLQTL